MSIKELEAAVVELPPGELSAFSAWFQRYTRRAEILRKLDRGLAELDRGEGTSVDFEAVKRRGRQRLAEHQAGRSNDAG
jgi:hypothetical protein